MFRMFVKVSWRTIKKYWFYNLINVFGLTVALTVVFFLGIFVTHELQFDRFNSKEHSIFRIIEYLHYDGSTPVSSAGTAYNIAPYFKSRNGELADFTRIIPGENPSLYPGASVLWKDKKLPLDQVICTENSFFQTFDYHILQGSRNELLKEPNTIVLSESYAKKLFGSAENAVEKTIGFRTADSVFNIRVSGVIADFPAQSHIQANAIMPFPRSFDTTQTGTDWSVILGPSYIVTRARVNIKELEKKLTKDIHERNAGIDIKLQPLDDVHLGSAQIEYDYLNYLKSDRKDIYIFFVCGIIMLVIACANFINLSLSIAGFRGKELVVKQISGATRFNLFLQLLVENIIIVGSAFVLAMVAVLFMLPYINGFFNKNIPLQFLYSGSTVLTIIAGILLVSIISCIYPYKALASVQFTQALKSKLLFNTSRSSLLRFLTIGQFSFSFVFISALIIIYQQLNFIRHKNVGYEYTNIINLPFQSSGTSLNIDFIRTELNKINGVSDVTYSKRKAGDGAGLFGINYTDNEGKTEASTALVHFVSPNYLNFFRMKFVEGANFHSTNPQNEYIINEAFAKNLGWKDPVGKNISLSWLPMGRVVGMVKDFHYASLRQPIEPLVLAPISDKDDIRNIYIKVTHNNYREVISRINSFWNNYFPNEDFRYSFVDDQLESMYEPEKQLNNVIGLAGLLSVLIACTGLFGISLFILQQRSKEISIRKVLGANERSLLFMLSSYFIKMITISIIVSIPVSVLIMYKWLQNYAYRVHIEWWVFLVASLFILGVGFITVLFQCLRVSRLNPVHNIGK